MFNDKKLLETPITVKYKQITVDIFRPFISESKFMQNRPTMEPKGKIDCIKSLAHYNSQ